MHNNSMYVKRTYEYSVDALGDRLDNRKPINIAFIGLTTASTNQVLPCIIVQLGYGGDVMEINEAISLYMDYCLGRQLRNKTQESYKQTLRLFAAWIINEQQISEVRDISERHIRLYTAWLRNRGKYTFSYSADTELSNKPSHRRDYNQSITITTVNNYLRNLRSFFVWLVDEAVIESSPMRKVKLIPNNRVAKNYLEDDEVRSLMASMRRTVFYEYRDLIAMMVMLDCGTRLGETLSIEVNEIDLKDRIIYLPPEKTKSHRGRTVFFSERTANELCKWIDYKEKRCHSNLLLPIEKTGKPVSVGGYESNFRKYIDRAGIIRRITPHTLRNNFAKRCLLSGMDIYTLSRILGHSSVTITERAYLDITQRDLQNKYEQHSPLASIYHDKTQR